MRHRVYGKKLSRGKDERDVLFKSLVHSLFSYGTIQTSEAKAKAIKGLVDKIINIAKSKNTQRLLQSYLINKSLRERLIKEIVPKLSDRVSGYTSLVRLGTRQGDRSTMVRISLIHNEQLKPIEKETSNKKPASPAKRGEQVTKKKEEKVKKPAARKVAPTKKTIRKRTTSRRRTK